MTAPDRLAGLPKDRLIAEFSLWSADLINLAGEIARVDDCVDIYHVDVSDGHFSPALLFFPDQIARVRHVTAKPIHVHLMCADAVVLSQIEQFAEAGADLISLHLENSAVLTAALDRLDRLGIPAGIVLRVETPVAEVVDALPRIRFLTLLGTAIGVKGQSLSETAPGRLREAARLIAEAGLGAKITLAADGGIRENTVPVLRASGADSVVMGSLAFGAPDLAARIAWVRGQPKAA
jgi:ribulose-phosphate 3-epimerase